PPREAVDAGRLRHDLFHRLCVFRIDLPPLRDRRDDIPVLARHLLAGLAARHGRGAPDLSASAVTKPCDHHYPANVRELRNILERALIVTRGDTIAADDLTLQAPPASGAVVTEGITLPAGVTAADAERILIMETLKRVHNNKAEAARRLGLDVKTI